MRPTGPGINENVWNGLFRSKNCLKCAKRADERTSGFVHFWHFLATGGAVVAKIGISAPNYIWTKKIYISKIRPNTKIKQTFFKLVGWICLRRVAKFIFFYVFNQKRPNSDHIFQKVSKWFKMIKMHPLHSIPLHCIPLHCGFPPPAGHFWLAKMGRGKINNQKWGGAK